MIVSEFVEWLKTIDQGATVRCIHGTKHGAVEIEFSIEKETFDYVDFRGNMFAAGKPHENSRYLSIGKWS